MVSKAWKLNQILTKKIMMNKPRIKAQLTKSLTKVLATITLRFNTRNLSQKQRANPNQKSKLKRCYQKRVYMIA